MNPLVCPGGLKIADTPYIGTEFNNLWRLHLIEQIDKKKRKTLKGMAAAAGVTALSSIPVFATGSALTDKVPESAKSARQVWPPVAVKSPIELTTRVSAIRNDIEVVLTNTGRKAVTLTQLSPSQVNTPRGHFDLADLLREGPRQLAAGESISVPITHHAIDSAAGSLHQLTRTGLSIVTDADDFAAVSYAVVA